jgi:hypothetical protein
MQDNENEATNKILIGIDPGSSVSGMVILSGGQIEWAGNPKNDQIFDILSVNIQKNRQIQIVVEDIRPYSLKLSPQIIETCKFLGEMRYRLKEAGLSVEWIPRNSVKKWVFDTFPQICNTRIAKKIEKKGGFSKSGVKLSPTFVYVDDRIVLAAMKERWNIETPKPGKRNSLGITEHSWQALGLVSYYLDL